MRGPRRRILGLRAPCPSGHARDESAARPGPLSIPAESPWIAPHNPDLRGPIEHFKVPPIWEQGGLPHNPTVRLKLIQGATAAFDALKRHSA